MNLKSCQHIICLNEEKVMNNENIRGSLIMCSEQHLTNKISIPAIKHLSLFTDSCDIYM